MGTQIATAHEQSRCGRDANRDKGHKLTTHVPFRLKLQFDSAAHHQQHHGLTAKVVGCAEEDAEELGVVDIVLVLVDVEVAVAVPVNETDAVAVWVVSQNCVTVTYTGTPAHSDKDTLHTPQPTHHQRLCCLVNDGPYKRRTCQPVPTT